MSEAVIHIVRRRATPMMMKEMLQSLGSYIKLAVDVRRAVLAGGGELNEKTKSACPLSKSRSGSK